MTLSYYVDIVKGLSNSARYYAASLLPKFDKMVQDVSLEGKDIPGVTVDTIEYLIEHDECICGTKFSENSKAKDNIMKLKKLVPPEMLGGAIGKLQNTLENWQDETKELSEQIRDKADLFNSALDTIDEKQNELDNLAKKIDRKTNLGPVRLQNREAKNRMDRFASEKSKCEYQIEVNKESKAKKVEQLDNIAKFNKENQQIYRAIAYTEAIYKKADQIANNRKNTTVTDLNKLIEQNFQRMFNDHEKYAKLGDDYKVHVYYHQVGNLMNYEEENLSNGETIAINFVFIVSILELAKKYRELEKDNDEYGMEDAILGLPLVLDGPFSALSNENTTLVANRLPQFAEQVIIFMLDKDWEASGLEKYTLPEYCYRVNKDDNVNSSSIESNKG